MDRGYAELKILNVSCEGYAITVNVSIDDLFTEFTQLILRVPGTPPIIFLKWDMFSLYIYCQFLRYRVFTCSFTRDLLNLNTKVPKDSDISVFTQNIYNAIMLDFNTHSSWNTLSKSKSICKSHKIFEHNKKDTYNYFVLNRPSVHLNANL